MSKQARSVGLGKQRESLEPEKDLDETEVAPVPVGAGRQGSCEEVGECNHKKDLLSKCLALLMRGWAQQPLPLVSKVNPHFIFSFLSIAYGKIGDH